MWRRFVRPMAAFASVIISLHPLLYLAAYVMAIPLFALRFHGLEGEFYQSTYLLDPTLRNHRNLITSRLSEIFRHWLRQYREISTIPHVRIERAEIYNLTLNGKNIEFTMELALDSDRALELFEVAASLEMPSEDFSHTRIRYDESSRIYFCHMTLRNMPKLLADRLKSEKIDSHIIRTAEPLVENVSYAPDRPESATIEGTIILPRIDAEQ